MAIIEFKKSVRRSLRVEDKTNERCSLNKSFAKK
jgi:hypothetical protein